MVGRKQYVSVKICIVPDCNKFRHGSTYCQTHAIRMRKYGNIDPRPSDPVVHAFKNAQTKLLKRTMKYRGQRVGCYIIKQAVPGGFIAQCDCGRFLKIHTLAYSKLTKNCKACKPLEPYPLEGRRVILARYRCETETSPDYARWGARGIKCFLTNSAELVDAIGMCPSTKYHLGRIDNNGHYEIGNVEWQLPKVNCNNTRACRFIDYNGERRTLTQWADHIGHKHSTTIRERLKRGWSVQKALTTSVK